MASRDMQATFTRVLHLGLSVFGYLRAFGELHFSSFLLAGNLSMASPVAVEQLLEIVPLPFLQRLVCFLFLFREPVEEMSQRVAPFVRAPHLLEVAPFSLPPERMEVSRCGRK